MSETLQILNAVLAGLTALTVLVGGIIAYLKSDQFLAFIAMLKNIPIENAKVAETVKQTAVKVAAEVADKAIQAAQVVHEAVIQTTADQNKMIAGIATQTDANAAAIQEVHTAINSRLSQLVDATAAASSAQGEAKGRAVLKKEQDGGK